MPILDGAAVLRRIRGCARTATLPVVVISAGGPDIKARALDEGADRFVAKPPRLIDIVDAVASVLDLDQG